MSQGNYSDVIAKELTAAAVKAVEQSPLGHLDLIAIIEAVAEHVRRGAMPKQILDRLSGTISAHDEVIRRLKAENVRFREELEFYASAHNYGDDDSELACTPGRYITSTDVEGFKESHFEPDYGVVAVRALMTEGDDFDTLYQQFGWTATVPRSGDEVAAEPTSVVDGDAGKGEWQLFWVGEESEVYAARSLEEARAFVERLTGEPVAPDEAGECAPSPSMLSAFEAEKAKGISEPFQFWTGYP